MLPPGRRRCGALSPLTICLAVLLLLVNTASAAVLGIDFGTLNIKAAIVKPGIPLDIVLTKDSKRKEVAAIAFKPNRDGKNNIVAKAGTFPERAYGSDALSLQGRFPGEVFPNLKLLLGLQSSKGADESAAIYKQRYPGVLLEEAKELGTRVFKSAAFVDEASSFSVEELIGMQLANIKRNALTMAGKGSVVDDAVIVIPPFYTADERQAIVKAANFAGLQVMALITDGMAVGLDYAKTRTFPEVTKGETPEHHLVFDMGAGSTSATILRFQSRSVKDVGRLNKTIQELQVVGAGWERNLGGDVLNHVIMDDFVKKLMTKPALKSRGTTEEEIRKNGRIMSRFFKEAERARQILSANSEASASFEEILPDIDLRVKITRVEFEKLAEGYADRVEKPIQEALKMAKLGMADLDSIILHGGAVRTPFVQSRLQAAVDDQGKLRSNVNPDESAVFGAAFKAASMSASFKVKEIRAADLAGYATSLLYTDKGNERRKPLFGPNAPVGVSSTVKQVSFKDREDFTFGFVQNVEGTERKVLKVQSENLTASVQALERHAGCDMETISTKFSVRLGLTHGLPEITAGSVSCEVDQDAKSGSIGDSVKGWLGFGKKDQEPLKEAGEEDGPVEQVDAASTVVSSAVTGSSSTSSTAPSAKAEEIPKKQLEVIPLRWTTSPEGKVQPSTDDIKHMSERLKQFDASDKARYARDEAQNVLEGYTYSVRDFLENKEYESVSTKEERNTIDELLQSTRSWMEGGELGMATKEVLRVKYDALKALVEPIQQRRTESTKRPDLVKALKKGLDELQKGILRVESDAAKVASSIKSAATASSSSSTAEVTESASAGDDASDLDNLEEPVKSEETAKPIAKVVTNPYDAIDLEVINETYKSVSDWLKEKLEAQDKLKPYEDPVVLARDVERKTAELAQSLQDLLSRAKKAGQTASKKPKPSKAKAAKKAKPTVETPTDAEDPVPAEDDPVSEEERPDRSGTGKKPVKGNENIEDMMNWMKKAKAGSSEDPVHEEL